MMPNNIRDKSDPWHVDILIQFLQQTLVTLAEDYHQKPNPRNFYQTITLLHDVLDALTVQIPDMYPLTLRRRDCHPHLHAKQLKNHIVQTKRE
ncbi:hypothetical protein [Sulfobacillus thermosulfidooxidans]|uniref:hypothetical protein n=1 Tax=Sulfobacillus thermosulfidooxidans TaxID=28034 RepID=UPI001112ADE0|nr:hypothetical protein [Sulfobacillus thermosulfidooxidans]